jgi:hypothetical protein
MMKLNDKWLLKRFIEYNSAYFDGLVPSNIRVRFGKPSKTANAEFDSEMREIVIDDVDRKNGNQRYIKINLLHEMVHAYLDVQGYIGHMSDPAHGMRFQGELCRLFRIGAYDGLL